MSEISILIENLETIRRARNQTVPEFARSMDVPKSTLCGLLASGNATLDTLVRISKGLDIPLWRLLYDYSGNEHAAEEFTAAQWAFVGLDALARLSPDGRRKIAFTIEEVIQNEAHTAAVY